MRILPDILQACRLCRHFNYDPMLGPRCVLRKRDTELEGRCDNWKVHDRIGNDVYEMASDIMKAYIFLREHNQSIPDESLEFIRMASLRQLRDLS